MEKIKIIDLLNKIANGEEAPKKIYYKKQWWEYNPSNDYEGTDWGGCLMNNVLICDLNDEVEIIEEKPYMGMATANIVTRTDTQDVKCDIYFFFGNDFKIYTIDTYSKTIVEKRKEDLK